jgi:hypothetical protein
MNQNVGATRETELNKLDHLLAPLSNRSLSGFRLDHDRTPCRSLHKGIPKLVHRHYSLVKVANNWLGKGFEQFSLKSEHDFITINVLGVVVVRLMCLVRNHCGHKIVPIIHLLFPFGAGQGQLDRQVSARKNLNLMHTKSSIGKRNGL